MSHAKERQEPICLNCNAVVYGRYCHVCGQENTEIKETFWQVAQHFLYDITHFDGKFFSTLKYLLFRPGFLSIEYNRGRRMSYLNPIKMYVFTSAFFFILLNTIFHEDASEKKVSTNKKAFVYESGTDSITFINNDTAARTTDSIKYKSIAAYRAAQLKLPEAKRDSWIEQVIEERRIQRLEKYNWDVKRADDAFWKDLSNGISKMMFVLLPLIALLFKLFYRRHNYYYVQHLIFNVHLFIGYYIILIFINALIAIADINKTLAWVDAIAVIPILYLVYYGYKSMRNFYGQSRRKTLLKYFLIASAAFFLFLLVWLAFAAIYFIKG